VTLDPLAEDLKFYAAAERRIWRFQLAIGIAGAITAGWLAGGAGAAGFAVGAALSSLSFAWLKQSIDALADKAVGAETRQMRRKRRLLVAKFAGRYGLIGLAVYVILKHTHWDVRALLAGLFLFVAAVLAEICFEIVEGLVSNQDGT